MTDEKKPGASAEESKGAEQEALDSTKIAIGIAGLGPGLGQGSAYRAGGGGHPGPKELSRTVARPSAYSASAGVSSSESAEMDAALDRAFGIPEFLDLRGEKPNTQVPEPKVSEDLAATIFEPESNPSVASRHEEREFAADNHFSSGVRMPEDKSLQRSAPGWEEEEGEAVFVSVEIGSGAPELKALAGVTSKMSNMRRYADGFYTTAKGETFRPRNNQELPAQSIELPYRSTDVIKRLGGYDLLSELGRGGMGVVYKAYSISLCRMCAIKVLKPSDDLSEAAILRFQNEAMLSARLRHPNIVGVFDSGEEDGLFYFVMEFIEGRDLADMIEAQPPEMLERGLPIMLKVCRALAYAHEHGIVHRDIKPENILVGANDEPFITDFGIAKGMDQDLKLTAAEAMMGTPFYMSPEQANGEVQNIGPASDVYAFGATLFHMITGRVVFPGTKLYDVIFALLRREPESPRAVAKRVQGRDISLDLETITLKALEKEVDRRYMSAAEVADDLEAFLDDRPISARPISAGERLMKLFRRNRALFAGASVVLGILLLMTGAFGAVTVFNMRRTSNSLRDLDRKAAIDQAATLERAIASNMIEGRADIVRRLVAKLRKDPNIASIEVVRPNRTLAYTDLSTRKFVEQRLKKPEVLAWTKKKYPWMMKKLTELQRVGFANIDLSKHKKRKRYKIPVPLKEWNSAVVRSKIRTVVQEKKGHKTLTVLWPIKNGGACQVCHGMRGKAEAYSGTAKNAIRAILVVRRFQDDVERRIHENRRATIGIGMGTTFGFLLLLFLLVKLFGIGVKPRSFGSNTRQG